MWKPLAPVSLLRKPKLPKGPKLSPAKAIQIIDPRPLPHSKTHTKLPSSPTPSLHSENPSFADHDYCLPGTEPACAEKGRRWNVKQQSSITIKPIEQRAPAGCPRKCAVQPLDHRTLSGSVLLSPDSSPCRLEADTASRDSTEFSSSRRFCYYSPEKSERGRARRRSRTRSSSSSESDSSGSRSSSPLTKRRRRVYLVIPIDELLFKIKYFLSFSNQISQFGCKSFALLFDDIEHNICPADKEVFSSFAHAQISLTNEIFQYLGEPETFLFCPTEYCGTFCYPNVSQSPYLLTVGEKLLPGIDVLWTGPKVVSKDITVESIEEVSRILKRAPVIWDNIHANDYDQKRLFLGPFKGRSTELIPRLKGVLTNPNCEFETNFVAIHTLATWYKSNMNGVRKDVVMSDSEDSTVSIQIKLENEGSDEEIETDMLYSPQLALKLALQEWLGGVGVPHLYNSRQVPHSGAKSTAIDVASLVTPNLGSSTTVSEWRARAEKFEEMCCSVIQMFTRLSNSANRTILYDLYPYIWDIKSIISMVKSFVQWLGCELSSKVPFYTFQVDEEEGEEEENVEHFLELRTVCLGDGVKDENNVVEVTALNHQGKKVSVPVANLHLSCMPMVSFVPAP
ncbi:UNVERIFIED_CONTAM: hypothetical protein FKN15_037761 [Acipenser sinensis]